MGPAFTRIRAALPSLSRDPTGQSHADIRPGKTGFDAVMVARVQSRRLHKAAGGKCDLIALVIGKVDRASACFAVAALGDRRRPEDLGQCTRPAHGVRPEPSKGCESPAGPASAHAAVTMVHGRGFARGCPGYLPTQASAVHDHLPSLGEPSDLTHLRGTDCGHCGSFRKPEVISPSIGARGCGAYRSLDHGKAAGDRRYGVRRRQQPTGASVTK
jgi:hypothetical protein